MNLSIFVIVPLLMLLGLWLARNDKQVRGVMVAGASVLLGLSIYLVFAFLEARETMPADQAPMLSPYPVCLGLNHCTSTIHSVWMVSQW